MSSSPSRCRLARRSLISSHLIFYHLARHFTSSARVISKIYRFVNVYSSKSNFVAARRRAFANKMSTCLPPIASFRHTTARRRPLARCCACVCSPSSSASPSSAPRAPRRWITKSARRRRRRAGQISFPPPRACPRRISPREARARSWTAAKGSMSRTPRRSRWCARSRCRTFAAMTYVLYQCGTTQPTQDVDGSAFPADARFFTVPVQRVATGLSVGFGYLEQLGLRDKLKLIDPAYVHAPCVQKAEEDGTLAASHVIYDWVTSTFNYTLWHNSISTNNVEMVITDEWDSGFSNSEQGCAVHAVAHETRHARATFDDQIHLFVFQQGDPSERVLLRPVRTLELHGGPNRRGASSRRHSIRL